MDVYVASAGALALASTLLLEHLVAEGVVEHVGDQAGEAGRAARRVGGEVTAPGGAIDDVVGAVPDQ